MILLLAKALASCGGVGYIPKGSGTVAALMACLVWYYFLKHNSEPSWMTAMVIAGIFLAGVWSASVVEQSWGKDSSKVVIDEAVGMWVSLLLVPFRIKYILIGIILFRFFDIAKPFFIRRSEKLPSGWGVMTDDLLAGIFSNLILQIIAKFNLC
jgi:phosphatidylglycerophosphatase A